MIIRQSLRRLLLAGMLCLLSAAFAAEYNPTPAPVNADPAEVVTKLNTLKNNLFFLGHMFDSADVQFDAFLIPNGSYATLEYKWAKLVSTAGKNILRVPTAKEKAEGVQFNAGPELYTADRKADVSHAEGKVTVRVPCVFARVEFAANEKGVTKTDDPISVTLKECKGNTAALTIKGAGEVDPIIILRDATGGSLQMNEISYSTDFEDNREMDFRMQGTIAKVEVYLPTGFAAATLNIVVPAEPEVMEADAPVIKSSRYRMPTETVEGATFDLAAVKAQTSVDLRFDENQIPELIVNMPRVLNSAFARVDFGKPKTVDAAGKEVRFATMQGKYATAHFMDGVGFNGPLQPFARASGSITVRYPGIVRTVVLTPAKPREGNIAAQFRGAKIAVTGLPKVERDDFSYGDPELIRAFDATGRELRSLNYSGFEFENNVNWSVDAFWGTPTEVRLLVVENWLTLTLPYDLALVKEPAK
ncbi:MAG: hypothetical protein ACYDCO_10150 [Armatimonadota bacterium]